MEYRFGVFGEARQQKAMDDDGCRSLGDFYIGMEINEESTFECFNKFDLNYNIYFSLHNLELKAYT